MPSFAGCAVKYECTRAASIEFKMPAPHNPLHDTLNFIDIYIVSQILFINTEIFSSHNEAQPFFIFYL